MRIEQLASRDTVALLAKLAEARAARKTRRPGTEPTPPQTCPSCRTVNALGGALRTGECRTGSGAWSGVADRGDTLDSIRPQ